MILAQKSMWWEMEMIFNFLFRYINNVRQPPIPISHFVGIYYYGPVLKQLNFEI